jgi:alkyl hydroperoxide reductase subunit AhpC
MKQYFRDAWRETTSEIKLERRNEMAVRVGKPAPEFEGEAWTKGAHGPKKVGLAQHRGKWVVLFFYPRDFTFICPTEIASFGAMQKDFERENAVVIGVSTDSFYTHKAWFGSDPRLANINYPVIADTGHQVSGAFDVLLEDGAALRGTFIIDPEGILRHMSVNELDVGRNVNETLRVLRAADRRTMSCRLETRSIYTDHLRRMAGKSVTAFAKTGVGRYDQKVADHQILCRSDRL